MNADSRNLIIWLAMVCVVIYLMIVVGGVTRLTQSGLSMVDWQPIMGVFPPSNQEEWQATFDAYKQYPEYQKINRGMNVDEFKSIFYWEYGHRVLGRVIGLLYLVPFVAFLALGRVEKQWVSRLWIGFVLGGLQGLMGWYMVKSGLVDIPHVSHYRLAAHLSLALVILVFLFWLILDIARVKREDVNPGYYRWTLFLAVVLAIQFVFGAFTAGLDAGRGFNTWPMMYGQFLADAAVMMEPFWVNFFENGVMIQFVHRWVGAILLLGVVGLSLAAIRQGVLKNGVLALLVITVSQFVLGVLTLLQAVPVVLGSLHQAVACLMLIALVYVTYIARGNPQVGMADGDSQA
ncbi:MAG: heme A synthase [Gammaproteobacteria bacterium]|nr:heme A synthase [Gammaproteobacteria bacterium]MBT4493181.1 heme A synthase [Gammaproteobacteria bacterium]MBT7372293.1 heme A synthase [Gammaproteobacteria bacterium]